MLGRLDPELRETIGEAFKRGEAGDVRAGFRLLWEAKCQVNRLHHRSRPVMARLLVIVLEHYVERFLTPPGRLPT